MNKLLRLKKAIASLVVAGVVIPTLSHSVTAYAQAGSADDKELALWAIAAQARDQGDLATAKAKLEEILVLNPNAVDARDTLAAVNRELTASQGRNAVTAPAVVTPKTPLDRVAHKHATIQDEVRAAMFEAQAAAGAGETDHAINLLDRASASLPDTAGSEELRGSISLLRQQIISESANGVDVAARAIADKVEELGQAQQVAQAHVNAARQLIARDKLDAAQAELDQAVKLQRAVATERTHTRIRQVQSELLQERIYASMEVRDFTSADRYLSDLGKLQGEESKTYLRLKKTVEAYRDNPRYQAIANISPKFPAQEQKVGELLTRAQAQYLYGDYEGAATTYKEVLQYQSYNTHAKQGLMRIQRVLAGSSAQNRELLKDEMLAIVDEQWLLPRVFDHEDNTKPAVVGEDPTEKKLKDIIIPTINLKDASIDKAIETLSLYSVDFDPERKGVNMVTISAEQGKPISLYMRDASLKTLLDFVVRSAGFRYEIENGTVEVSPGISPVGSGETREFRVASETVQKITGRGGRRGGNAGGGAGGVWDTQPAGGGVGAGGEDEISLDEAALKNYFQRYGITFDNPAYGLSYNGVDTLTVTHTVRNLERIFRILQEKNEVGKQQVSIETKFIDVSAGSLRQLSTNWVVSRDGNIRAQTGLRTLNSAFGSEKSAQPGRIVRATGTETFENTPPDLNSANMGPDFSTFSGVIGSIGRWDLELLISAIVENEGSDLMAAPSVTVLDGITATVKIAQELIFPSEYEEVQANVGTSSGGDAGTGASVAITAGAPQFADAVETEPGIWHVGPYREVGVVLAVTPEVSDEDRSIKLELKPRITEFEGFVEYGGTSVAIAGDTTVTVPSGFFMPVFSIRQVDTTVRIFDGATVIIGGLTREESKTVNDKIPVLGDIPLIGAAFRSEGKSTVKRNLMIFVTASLISPGGSPKHVSVGNIRAGSTFSNPKVLTPGGPVSREVTTSEAVPK